MRGDRLFALSGHTRGVGVLVADPVLSTPVAARVYSAGSERGMRCWEVPVEAAEVRGARGVGGVMVVHETSVNAVRFEGEEAEMWTASADMTAKRVDVRGAEGVGKMDAEGEVVARVDTVLEHPDYVNDIVVDPRGRWAVTACRDEEVRVWDIAVGFLSLLGSMMEILTMADGRAVSHLRRPLRGRDGARNRGQQAGHGGERVHRRHNQEMVAAPRRPAEGH